MDEYDWPGWLLADNQHGKDFDLDARKRMVQGSRKLLPLLEKYRHQLGKVVLEAGPFFEPLVTPSPRKKVVYVDNDPSVIEYLKIRHEKASCITRDINHDDDSSLRNKISAGTGQALVNTVVASQLLNYVRFQTFFTVVEKLLHPGGLFFLNHSTDYGLPVFFSKGRPKSNHAVLKELEKSGFVILEAEEIPSQNKEIQPYPRLLVVAKKKSLKPHLPADKYKQCHNTYLTSHGRKFPP